MRMRDKNDQTGLAVEAVRGGGKPLARHVQLRAAEHYGFSFDHVRVHDAPPAHHAARSLHAAAYTLGGDIGFAAGRYDPGSARGEALLQHELRHVAQQRWSAASLSPQIDPADSVYEHDARAPSAAPVPTMPEQRIQCAPEDEQFSLGTGLVDTVGRQMTSDGSWPFIKAVLEGFVGGLKSDVKAGRADAAKSHLSELMRPWNAAKFYGGYLVGLVIGLVSPITDLVKGVVGLVKLGAAGLEWLAKWSPIGIAISAERRSKIAQLNVKLNELMGELGTSLATFVTDPKGAAQKFKGFLDGLMQMALSKARGIGAGAAHSLFDFLGKDFYDMGKGIGEVIGTLVAQVLMLVFSEAIGNLIAKGASFVGKAAEFAAGKAVEVFTWFKGLFAEAAGLLRNAVKGALKAFEGVINKAVEAFDALVALFSEAAAVDLAGEKVAAGVGKGVFGKTPNAMEARMVSSTRTSPATVADLTPPKVHPSKLGKETGIPKPAAKAPKSGSAAKNAEQSLTPTEQRGKDILEEFSERQELAQTAVREEQTGKSIVRTRRQAGVSLEEDHHIATRYRARNKKLFKQAGTSIDADLNLIKDFPEHGQLRGWYDWKNRSYRFVMKGHHPEYNEWVTRTLRKAVPPGMAPDVSLSRIMIMNGRLEAIIRAHPEVLSHGPDILPAALRNLTF